MSLNPICQLREDGWCDRHQTTHLGHIRTLALDPGEKGSLHRRRWDERRGQPTPLPPSRVLRHVPPEVRLQRLALCRSCPLWQERCTHPDALRACGCNRIEAALDKPHAYCPLRPPEGPRWDRWPPDGQRRHLLYHVMPIHGNGVWQWNLERLKSRLPLFNGRRVVAIATDHRTDSAAAVKAFLGDQVEYLEFTNDPGLREVQTFHPLLERVAPYLSDQDYTFYGHAKGVTKAVNRAVSVHPWTTIMYETCLDYWPLIQERLGQHPCVGSFKKVGRGFSSAGNWHYSGTFFWFRNDRLFARDWRRIDRVWWGTEAYLGLHFTPEEAGCLFKDGVIRNLNLYRDAYLKHTILPEYERWKQEYRRYLSLTTAPTPSAGG